MVSKDSLCRSFPWQRYSKKLASKINRPRNVGRFKADEGKSRGLRSVLGSEGAVDQGNKVAFFWLVDEEDGVIVDCRFQAFGHSALIGAAELACEILPGKNYDQARRMSADILDRQGRDRENDQAFPDETFGHLNLVLDAIDSAAELCTDIPVSDSYLAIPVSEGPPIEGDGYPGWEELGLKQKLQVIEEILDKDIRPFVEMDAGGVEVLNLLNDREVIIAYTGACTSCFASTGSTLSYIQQVLKAKAHPSIVVVPDFGDLG